MAEYAIQMREEAKGDLDFYDVTARRTVVSAIRLQLMHEPLNRRETANRYGTILGRRGSCASSGIAFSTTSISRLRPWW